MSVIVILGNGLISFNVSNAHGVIESVLTSIDGLFQELDSLLLALEGIALLVVEPSKLLENFSVVWIPLKDTLVSGLSRLKLRISSA